MSGVVKGKRKINKDFETITHANEMRYAFTHLLFRDFGTHNKTDTVRRKYRVHLEEEIPQHKIEWLLEDERDVITHLLAELCDNLTGANSIYPITWEELALRRNYQDEAIANCFKIKTELQYIITIFNVNVDKYIQYSDMLDYEVTLIKGWRKANSKYEAKIIEEEVRRNNLIEKYIKDKIKEELNNEESEV